MSIIVSLIFVMLAGCKEEDIHEESLSQKAEEARSVSTSERITLQKATTTTSYQVGDQEFDIVPVLDPMLEYIQVMEEEPLASNTNVFTETVIEPFRKEAFGEGEGQWLKEHWAFTAPRGIYKLKQSVEALDQEYDKIIDLIQTSVEKSSTLLPGDTFTVYVFPYNPDKTSEIEEMNGVTGVASGNSMIIHIDPNRYTEASLQYTISHEYHHLSFYDLNQNKQNDLIRYALIEGRADSFAKLLYPNYEAPWTEQVSEQEEDTIMNWIEGRGSDYTREDIDDFRKGNDEIPKWSNYKIGFHIMQTFIQNNPEASVEEWTRMGPDELLEKSGYHKE